MATDFHILYKYFISSLICFQILFSSWIKIEFPAREQTFCETNFHIVANFLVDKIAENYFVNNNRAYHNLQ